jgi:hypothetical protein
MWGDDVDSLKLSRKGYGLCGSVWNVRVGIGLGGRVVSCKAGKDHDKEYETLLGVSTKQINQREFSESSSGLIMLEPRLTRARDFTKKMKMYDVQSFPPLYEIEISSGLRVKASATSFNER